MREANLQALLSDDSEVRVRVPDLIKVYDANLAEDTRGTRLAHMIHAVHQTSDIAYDQKHISESRLPDAILHSLIQFLDGKHLGQMAVDTGSSLAGMSRNAKLLDKFSLRGVQYSTATCRSRDSRVLFQSPHLEVSRSQARPKPGQITHIFFYPDVPIHLSPQRQNHLSMYICVQPYSTLEPNIELNQVDEMYRQFGFAGGFLCRDQPSPPIIIEPSSIISHVAVTPLRVCEYKVLHVLPMDSVCFFLLF